MSKRACERRKYFNTPTVTMKRQRQQRRQILIYTPHVCLNTTPFDDPACDYRSRSFGRILRRHIPNSILVESRTKRSECDNNRVQCRQTPSRSRLRSRMVGKFVVFEVHTFSSVENWGGKNTNMPKDVEIVLLRMPHDDDDGTNNLIGRTYRLLKKHKFSVHILRGDRKNDVQAEIVERGGTGILIEFHDKLTVDRVRQMGKLLKRVVSAS